MRLYICEKKQIKLKLDICCLLLQKWWLLNISNFIVSCYLYLNLCTSLAGAMKVNSPSKYLLSPNFEQGFRENIQCNIQCNNRAFKCLTLNHQKRKMILAKNGRQWVRKSKNVMECIFWMNGRLFFRFLFEKIWFFSLKVIF